MKKLYSLIILIIISIPLLAQPKIGKISGTVIDKKTNSPIEGADVVLYREKDSSMVKGTSTDKTGAFTLDELTPGRFYLKANLIGYNFAVVSGLAINREQKEITLDPIKLGQGETTTDEIVVEGEKSLIEFRPDKKVFNVSKNMTSQGATLIDLLKEIPSVTVDQDNNVSLRGSEGVKIMIDGRPFGLEGNNRGAILEQIPASNVESIELITNPSAKFEAEGSSGIINIVLKKSENKGFGYNGTLGLNLGTGDKYNGQFSLNLKNSKLSIYGNYNYNSNTFSSSGSNERTNFLSQTAYLTDETSSGRRRMNGHMMKIGMDYNINQLNVVGISLSYRNSKRNRSDIGTNEEFDISNILTSKYINSTNSEDKGYNLNFNANYTKRFKTPQQLLTVDLAFSRDKDEDNTNTFNTYVTPVNNTPENRNEYSNETDDAYTGQIDYTHPFGKDAKLETGYRGSYKKRDNDFRLDLFDYNTNQFVTDANQSNRFIYKEQLHAVYAIYTNKIGDFGFSLGTRVEQTIIKGELVNNSQTFDRSYIDFFPSASISQKLSKTSEIQLSYARRVNRPRTRQLNPFISVSFMGGANNLSQGNPNLNPEFTDSYELSYIHYLPFATITPSVFYRHTKDQISRSRTLLDSVTTLTTFVNYNSSKYYGGELILNAQPVKFWNLNGTFSYYKTELDATNLSSGLSNSGYSWTARAMSNLFLPMDFSMQLSYFYSGKNINAQGTFEPFSSFDAAVKKDLFDKKLSLTLRVSDLFDSARFKANLTGTNFIESFERRRDSRTVFFNITYKFGEQEKKQFDKKKRDNNKDDDDGFDF